MLQVVSPCREMIYDLKRQMQDLTFYQNSFFVEHLFKCSVTNQLQIWQQPFHLILLVLHQTEKSSSHHPQLHEPGSTGGFFLLKGGSFFPLLPKCLLIGIHMTVGVFSVFFFLLLHYFLHFLCYKQVTSKLHFISTLPSKGTPVIMQLPINQTLYFCLLCF